MGRTSDQAKMRNFQDMIYQLSGSGSSDAGDCLDYEIMDGGIIHLEDRDEEYGYCQLIMLSPVQ